MYGSAVAFQKSTGAATIDNKMCNAYALALLDSGSTRGLITETLVQQHCPALSIIRLLVGLRTAANPVV